MKQKQKIFSFNHIDPSMEKKDLEEVKKLFRAYHKLWWCFKKLHKHEKRCDLIEKVSSSILVAMGLIAGGATMNPIVLGVISGLGLIVKTMQEVKNRGKKIEKARFAFTTYEKTLSDLRFALRSGHFNHRAFMIEMETIDGIVIDLGLNQEKFEKEYGERFE